MKKLVLLLVVILLLPLKFTFADDGKVTFYTSASVTGRTGQDFNLTKNTTGSMEFGAMYFLDANHSFAIRAGLREVPVFGEGLDGQEQKAMQIGAEKGYDLGFVQGFMSNTSLVLLIAGSDQLNMDDDFDLVMGFGFKKRLNVKNDAATLALMPFFTMTDIDGSNLIQVGLQLNITPPAE